MGRGNKREKSKSFSKFGNKTFGFSKQDFGEREMHKAKCSECGQDCDVPFKPTEGKPVYCRDCYRQKKKW